MTEYVEDTEWLDQIKKQTCPYCEFSLIKPYSNMKKCTKCDFELYGNPENLAYKIKEPPVEPLKENECPECAEKKKHNESIISTNLFYEKKERETVCLECGLVVKGSQHYTGLTKIDYPLGHHYENEITDENGQIIKRIG